MSLACCLPVLECVYCLACARWAWKRLLHSAGHDSETWGLASPVEFEPVPRLCRYILAVYEDDLDHPQWAPPGGYGIETHWVVLRKTYQNTHGRAPPYLIYVDHRNSDIVLAIRGFNFAQEGDYAVLLDNSLGKRKFSGGYVHNGLLQAAIWVFDEECKVLKGLLEMNPEYTLTFAGHSLGSGVAALLAMVAVHNLDKLGNLERNKIRCFAIAPARCVSLNLAVRYADVINSVVLQDDFLPRTATPLEDIFKSLFWCGRFPPVVRTAVPVDGRFEHIVLSCNATSDHAIIWIERESQHALDLMMESEMLMEIPPMPRMERQKTLTKEHNKEHKAALQRAILMSVPDAYSVSEYGTFDDNNPIIDAKVIPSSSTNNIHNSKWTEWIKRVFEKNDSGEMVLRRSTSTSS